MFRDDFYQYQCLRCEVQLINGQHPANTQNPAKQREQSLQWGHICIKTKSFLSVPKAFNPYNILTSEMLQPQKTM